MLGGSMTRAALLAAVLGTSAASAFQVAISDKDLLRQTCSGMWAGKGTRIELHFDASSKGTVSTLFYDYKDFDLIGKASKEHDVYGLPIKSYICTSQSVLDGLCTQSDLGNYIVNATNPSSVMTKRVDLGSDPTKNSVVYNVTHTGYYCSASVPMTSQSVEGDLHSAFTGRVNFINTFSGELAASEYPKLRFYAAMTLLYIALGGGWAYLCLQYRDSLLIVHHMVSALFALLVLDNAMQYFYYGYLNGHAFDLWTLASLDHKAGVTFVARLLLVLSSILDAARNSVSLFLLLIVSMGYGVVRPSIGTAMRRVLLLTGTHFVCGCIYSIGILLLVTETGGSVIFLFILPLSFALTSFMFWTLHSLNATIEYLGNRSQTFKKQYFVKLHRILVCAVVAIFAFFIVTSVTFSQASSDSFAPKVWPYRWFLLDGWMGILYVAVFGAVAWLWRPAPHSLRLSMSDEIGQDDNYARDFEVEEFAMHGDDEDVAERGEAKEGGSTKQQRRLSQGDEAFQIGDDDDDAHVTSSQRQTHKRQDSSNEEQQALIGGHDDHVNEKGVH